MRWMQRVHGTQPVTLDFDAIRAEYELPAAFPDEVEREAAASTDRFAEGRIDATELPLVTIDPVGAMDLDQAVHVERTGEGFLLSYAIADLGAFIVPGGATDREARRRGQTIYLPDGTVPLHPRILSEDRASLVAGADRPAVLWQVELGADGALRRARVRRATVRVRERLDYGWVQDRIDRDAVLPDAIEALPSFGAARAANAAARGAIELQIPTQELTRTEDGGWRLRLEPRTQVDAWNAECSLATGIAAAACQLAAGVGLLRTLPRPDADALHAFAEVARALGVDEPDRAPGALLASLPPTALTTLTLHRAATKLLRGSGYLAFDARHTGEGPDEEARFHAGVATEYAHATAPIRRLGDRIVNEICLAASGGEWFDLDGGPVAGTVDDDLVAALALDEVPGALQRAGQLANAVDNACLNLGEATVLAGSIGETFAAAQLRPGDGQHDAEIFVFEPPVIAQCRGDVPAGEPVEVRLVEADPATRKVRFEIVDPAASEGPQAAAEATAPERDGNEPQSAAPAPSGE